MNPTRATTTPPVGSALVPNLYFDRDHGTMAVKILPGEYYVSTRGEIITTVLGSCVSACVRDPVLGIGGMNHFMLPHGHPDSRWGNTLSQETRYGTFAMECLLNDMFKLGARRERLEFKVVGGGRVLVKMSDIGQRNVEFIREFLKTEKFRVTAEDLGGDFPRKVVYMPETGRMRVKRLQVLRNDTIIQRETRYLDEIDHMPDSGGVELF